ncbi:hypothetical protein BpHYR1_030527 [Brachionus plicatilis]|uniref:Uncharacterized protein n=1 Tax=Brachionus plicatilis TaxID=10195 RepID=A0A3M7S0L8_BRAPC|nr:hypothetical protein BpHYR1_030527 [Brachionus plicatilis]
MSFAHDETNQADDQTYLSSDPFDREKIIQRIKSLLKKAYKNHQPALTSAQSDQYVSLSPNFSLEYYSLDDSLKSEQASSIWKELFDYFDFYNNRSKSMQELDERIDKKRSEIGEKIDIILKLDYSRIKQVMDLDIKQTMFSILDYSKLYENKIYIDQLCYLNLLIQDDLNNICYIESLYPSIRCLKSQQPLYADPKFDSTAKTLLLWHKIVKDLMLKSDKLV